VSLARSKAVLELGKRLAAQLSEDGDLLASWMSHDIAQRIETAENNPSDNAAQDDCAQAILNLWKYRNDLPRRVRPLKDLEPLLRTIEALDVERTDHRYFPSALRASAAAEVDESTKIFLEFAIGLDYSSRILIRLALREAALRCASTTEPWLELAHLAGSEEDAERNIVKFILSDEDEKQAIDGDQIAALEDKLSRVESFIMAATVLATDLRAQLNNASQKND
jgi:hypothetical protein